MDIFEGPYYKTSKWFLEFLGLWPFQSPRRRRISFFVFFLLNSTVVLPQILLLIKIRGKNFTILIENSMSIMFAMACFVKYTVTFISGPRLESLLSQIVRDWQKMTDKYELEIMSKYGEEGRFLVLFYVGYVFLAWATYNMLPFIPPVMDVLFPLENGTLHNLVLPFYADYIFFEQIEYHYEACLHVFIVYFGTTSLFAGMDTIYVATVKHSCGLFAVICHRLEQMGKSSKDHQSMSFEIKPDSTVHRDLVRAIILHNENIKCVDLLEDSFSLCFLLVQTLIVIGIAILSFYMLHIYEQTFNMLRFSTFTMGMIIHLLYLNWVGQQIIDSSNEVFNSAYCSEWYLISKSSRHLIKTIMGRSLYPCQLTAGKIIILSMETFGSLMKTSMSYLTVLLSVA